MKLMIASDLHGSAFYAKKWLQRVEEERPDRILLLGDLLYHGPRNDLPEGYAPKEVIPLLNGLAPRLICVRGNCDAEVDQMVLDFPIMADYVLLQAEEHTVFATHGHIHSPEQLPRLFDVFYRGDAARTAPGKGSGIGLAVVKKACDEMHGTVWAENAENGGLRVTVSAIVNRW